MYRDYFHFRLNGRASTLLNILDVKAEAGEWLPSASVIFVRVTFSEKDTS